MHRYLIAETVLPFLGPQSIHICLVAIPCDCRTGSLPISGFSSADYILYVYMESVDVRSFNLQVASCRCGETHLGKSST